MSEFLISIDDMDGTEDNCEKLMKALDGIGIDAWFCEFKTNGRYK